MHPPRVQGQEHAGIAEWWRASPDRLFWPQVLLTLPPAARQDYFCLLSEPLLMLEQLLMNLKVDWADVAVRTLRSLLVGQEAGFSSADVDALLDSYASKALDFSCAPRERSRSGRCLREL